MAGIIIRAAAKTDLARLTEIYNHYVVHTAVTFDVEPYSVERRAASFEQFDLKGRYCLLVAEENGIVGVNWTPNTSITPPGRTTASTSFTTFATPRV